jgi:WhiB family redox-sensing transcriptional regulator
VLTQLPEAPQPARAATLHRADWRSQAACRGLDTELFFPGRGEAAPEAAAACASCPVRTECRTYAVESRQLFGIWGGTSERQRRRLRAERASSIGGRQ